MPNLFIYGTLRDATFLKAITGKTFKRNKAQLKGFQRFEQGTGFPYILRMKNEQVSGFVLWDVDLKSLDKLDRYEDEGMTYSRIKVTITVSGGKIKAETYVGKLANIRRTFGDHVDESITSRVEHYLQQQIGGHIKVNKRPGTGADIEFQVRKEFMECEIQHLLNLYFTNTYVSPNRITEKLSVTHIPKLKQVRENEAVKPFAPAYLDLSSRFMVFNRLAALIHADNRVQLFSKDPYCMHSLTNLVTMRLLNNKSKDLDYYLERHCPPCNFMKLEYTDYARGAVRIANIFYDIFKAEIDFIIKEQHNDREEGRIPMGVEMEFSNIGKHATSTHHPHDPVFNNFKYFQNFDLLRRLWRLGGHIDDHTMSNQSQKTDGGFLEFALGKNALLRNTSKPVSNDVNIITKLIAEVTEFVPVQPHSIHISLESVLGDIDWKQDNDVEQIKCLMLLAGDFCQSLNGTVIEKRVGRGEIVDPWGNTEIIVENMQFPNNPELREEAKNTIEFQIPRLRRNYSYEPMVMGLKGFYLGCNPRPYSSKLRIIDEPHIRQEAEAIRNWALNVQPLSNQTLSTFLEIVEKGLFTGLNQRTLKHHKRFLKNEMFAIEKELHGRNGWIRGLTLQQSKKTRTK